MASIVGKVIVNMGANEVLLKFLCVCQIHVYVANDIGTYA